MTKLFSSVILSTPDRLDQ